MILYVYYFIYFKMTFMILEMLYMEYYYLTFEYLWKDSCEKCGWERK